MKTTVDSSPINFDFFLKRAEVVDCLLKNNLEIDALVLLCSAFEGLSSQFKRNRDKRKECFIEFLHEQRGGIFKKISIPILNKKITSEINEISKKDNLDENLTAALEELKIILPNTKFTPQPKRLFTNDPDRDHFLEKSGLYHERLTNKTKGIINSSTYAAYFYSMYRCGLIHTLDIEDEAFPEILSKEFFHKEIDSFIYYSHENTRIGFKPAFLLEQFIKIIEKMKKNIL